MILNVPRINQHKRYGEEGYHYCTVGTTEMYLWWANGQPPGTWIGPVVYRGGGSGNYIADALNNYSAKHARCSFTAGGTLNDILHTLADGYPVPLGVDYLDAVIHSTGSVSDEDLRVGDTHPRASRAYGDGHWVLIIGYDSSNLYINDPDTGTTIRMTYGAGGGGLTRSAGGDGSIYLVLSTPE